MVSHHAARQKEIFFNKNIHFTRRSWLVVKINHQSSGEGRATQEIEDFRLAFHPLKSLFCFYYIKTEQETKSKQ